MKNLLINTEAITKYEQAEEVQRWRLAVNGQDRIPTKPSPDLTECAVGTERELKDLLSQVTEFRISNTKLPITIELRYATTGNEIEVYEFRHYDKTDTVLSHFLNSRKIHFPMERRRILLLEKQLNLMPEDELKANFFDLYLARLNDAYTSDGKVVTQAVLNQLEKPI